ncbi:unnamed protein product [Ciceribacter selenitireducens ATCC BAA-1503]|uniref:Uncharacterized protein n=1 Tax=Ciceribacter selenitireducens ATCC BAA-1503 TaxID=1336235 RepID=A0A376AA54_9HYPH|nr:unnamed protein product [Ciceribacter selenitireducens ATCC BAA-1503]
MPARRASSIGAEKIVLLNMDLRAVGDVLTARIVSQEVV